MSVHIRTADPKKDYATIARLISIVDKAPFPESRLIETDQRQTEGMILRRCVVEKADQLVGYSLVMRETWWKEPKRFLMQVIVDPDHRGQGIGTQAYEEAWRFMEVLRPTHLTCEVRDDDPKSLTFAKKRGFEIRRHLFESKIDLKTYDEKPFLPIIERVEHDGYAIKSLAKIGNTDENFQRLHAVNRAVALDDPASTGSFPAYEQFQKLRERDWFRPEGQLLAMFGDEMVGLAAVGYFALSNSMYNMGTGVLREHRGKGLAKTLKLYAIRFAKTYGADYITTNNDSENAPILAINEKLGYVRQLGFFDMMNHLKEAQHD